MCAGRATSRTPAFAAAPAVLENVARIRVTSPRIPEHRQRLTAQLVAVAANGRAATMIWFRRSTFRRRSTSRRIHTGDRSTSPASPPRGRCDDAVDYKQTLLNLDTLTWTKASHVIKSGFDWQNYRFTGTRTRGTAAPSPSVTSRSSDPARVDRFTGTCPAPIRSARCGRTTPRSSRRTTARLGQH